MSARAPLAERAIFLVDAHPLDSLVAALALRVREAALVHCAAQAHVADALKARLARHGIAAALHEIPVEPAERDALALLERLGPGWYLDHTGGIPGAAAVLSRAAAQVGVTADRSLRLDEERRCLRFDDGTVIPISATIGDRQVDVDDVLELAGLRRVATRDRPADAVVLDAARWLARRDPSGRRAVNAAGSRRGIDAEWLEAHAPRTLAAAVRADPDRDWFEYLKGTWLEDFTAIAVERAARRLGIRSVVATGLPLQRTADGGQLEIDVLALVGHRPHVISCTASSDADDSARPRAFEAERRAWQLGGPVVRPAVVARIGRRATETIERHFRDPSEPHRSTELTVFGDREIRAWPDGGGMTAWLAAGLALGPDATSA